MLIVKCPTCKKPVSWAKKNSYKPFCSKRCQLIDLGAWASEEHKIPGSADFDDATSEQLSDNISPFKE
ncbi:DNA gyrase inhibitor YacG [invertebrate metagenome]|uniref:DNA gyrase inhibitor YacG n=1 Tax=invertebrate metagenome TaxID=1711999 RepID=A0A2H9TAV8_9ZZZZ